MLMNDDVKSGHQAETPKNSTYGLKVYRKSWSVHGLMRLLVQALALVGSTKISLAPPRLVCLQ